MSIGIDDTGIRTAVGSDLVGAADGDDGAIANGKGLGPGLLGIDGVDAGIDEHGVSGSFRDRGCDEEQGDENESKQRKQRRKDSAHGSWASGRSADRMHETLKM